MRKIILLLLLQCSLAAVGQEKPKIFFSNKTIESGNYTIRKDALCQC